LGSIQNAKNYMQWINETIRLDATANNAKNRKIYRGQVYWCYFGINIGSEQSEKRPCVILQNDKGNLSSSNTIVAPITHSNSTLDIVIPISDKLDTLGNKILDGYVLLGNIATISKARLENYITELTAFEMKKVNEAIAKSIDIYFMFQKYENHIKNQQNHIINLDQTVKGKDEYIEKLESEIKNLKNEKNAIDKE